MLGELELKLVFPWIPYYGTRVAASRVSRTWHRMMMELRDDPAPWRQHLAFRCKSRSTATSEWTWMTLIYLRECANGDVTTDTMAPVWFLLLNNKDVDKYERPVLEWFTDGRLTFAAPLCARGLPDLNVAQLIGLVDFGMRHREEYGYGARTEACEADVQRALAFIRSDGGTEAAYAAYVLEWTWSYIARFPAALMDGFLYDFSVTIMALPSGEDGGPSVTLTRGMKKIHYDRTRPRLGWYTAKTPQLHVPVSTLHLIDELFPDIKYLL